MIKAVIFDFGKVIVSHDPLRVYSGFEKRVGLPEGFVNNYSDKNWDAIVLGDISLEKFLSDMKESSGQKDLDFFEIWTEERVKNRETNIELIELIKKLKKNYLVGILSNASAGRVAADEKIGIYKDFDFVLLSCREHLQKPDPKFYELALEKANAKPEEVVFIDDEQANIDSAKKLGIHAILYTDNKKLFAELKKLNVKM